MQLVMAVAAWACDTFACVGTLATECLKFGRCSCNVLKFPLRISACMTAAPGPCPALKRLGVQITRHSLRHCRQCLLLLQDDGE